MLEVPPATYPMTTEVAALASDGPIDASQLIVVTALPAEAAAHEALLDAIEKECKVVSVWRAWTAMQPMAA